MVLRLKYQRTARGLHPIPHRHQQLMLNARTHNVQRYPTRTFPQRLRLGTVPQLRRRHHTNLAHLRRSLSGHAMHNLTGVTALNIFNVHTTTHRHGTRVNSKETNRRTRIVTLRNINRHRALPIGVRLINQNRNTGLRTQAH